MPRRRGVSVPGHESAPEIDSGLRRINDLGRPANWAAQDCAMSDASAVYPESIRRRLLAVAGRPELGRPV